MNTDERTTETQTAGDNRISAILSAVERIAAQLAEIHRRLLAAAEKSRF
jgi:hypothetical protein